MTVPDRKKREKGRNPSPVGHIRAEIRSDTEVDHRIGNQQNFRRIGNLLNFFDLIHQLAVNMQTTGRIKNNDVKTALSEAVTNCIVHAYKGGVGTVTVEARMDDDTIHLKISDTGRGIENIEKAIQPFFTTLSDEEHSGMGFTIMQTFMSDFSIESAVDSGTIVRLSKKIGQNAARS